MRVNKSSEKTRHCCLIDFRIKYTLQNQPELVSIGVYMQKLQLALNLLCSGAQLVYRVEFSGIR